MKRVTQALLLSLLLVALLASAGCRRVKLEGADEVRVDRESVALAGAETARVNLEMGAGELVLKGEELGSDFLEAELTYSPEDLRPELDSDTDSETVEVDIRHRESLRFNFGESFRSEWDVRIAQGVPTGVFVQLGAGDGDLDLRGVDVVDLDIEMGAGELTLDLSGDRTRDLDGRIQAGVGSVVVRLPENVGVRVVGVNDGIGDWEYDGFSREGNYLVNDAYDDADVRIELEIQRGVGEVELKLVD